MYDGPYVSNENKNIRKQKTLKNNKKTTTQNLKIHIKKIKTTSQKFNNENQNSNCGWPLK